MTLYWIGFILGLWALILGFVRMLCIMARAGDLQSQKSYDRRHGCNDR